MSFNLAVWEGPKPATDADACAQFERLHAEQAAAPVEAPPSPAIRAFLGVITAEYPDITDLPDDRVDDGVWSDGPLVNDASGGFFYFGISGPFVHDVAPFVARVAEEQGLVCFDPQAGGLFRLE